MTLSIAILIACGATAVVSLFGGWLPMLIGLSHRRMQVLLSFVAGAMAGIAMLDLLPHAIEAISSEAACQTAAEPTVPQHDHSAVHSHGHDHGHDHSSMWPVQTAMLWLMVGFLAMYLLERFVCFHHHEPSTAQCGHSEHGHRLSFGAAFTGLSIHAVLAGMGLGAAIVLEAAQQASWPGRAMLLAIVLHKPLDGLAIVSLIGRDRSSPIVLWGANFAYALVTPAGVLMAWWWMGGSGGQAWAGPVVAVTAGILLCIALCDLLPELQAHAHDRVLLTVALLAGLTVAGGAALMH